jgi:hypothetical protein
MDLKYKSLKHGCFVLHYAPGCKVVYLSKCKKSKPVQTPGLDDHFFKGSKE